jgi:Phage tail tube protein
VAYGSGLSAQFGVAAETTVGTAVTVTKFFEFLSESIAFTPTWLRGEGLKAGQAYSRVSRVAQSRLMVGGDVEMEHADRGGMGLLWKHAIGSSATAVQIGTTTAYQQIHIPGSSGKVGLGLTAQVGRPQTDGTVRPHTYSGVKIVGWEFSCSDNEIAKLKLTLDGWNEATGTALASASYSASAGVFSFEDASTFTLGGTASTGGSPSMITITTGTSVTTLVKGVTITGTTPLATERFGLGNAGVKKEQLDNGFPTVQIKLDAEYTSRTELYDLLKANTTTALQLDFSQGDAGGTNPFRLSFIAPACKVLEGSPQVGGPDIVQQSLTLEAFDDGTNAPFQVRIVSTDTAL